MKVTDCKAERYSIYLGTQDPCVKKILCVEKEIWSTLGRLFERESEKNFSTTKNERFLTSFMYTCKDRMLRRFTRIKGL